MVCLDSSKLNTRIDESEPRRRKKKKKMGAITASVIAIVGVVLGWIAIEIACKPCLEQGREAIDRNLNPDYDPDDAVVSSDIRAPLNPPAVNTIAVDLEAEDPKAAAAIAASSHSDGVKAV
ncbi:hypothetical protein PS2_036185 [Malus domestica]